MRYILLLVFFILTISFAFAKETSYKYKKINNTTMEVEETAVAVKNITITDIETVEKSVEKLEGELARLETFYAAQKIEYSKKIKDNKDLLKSLKDKASEFALEKIKDEE